MGISDYNQTRLRLRFLIFLHSYPLPFMLNEVYE